MLSTFNPQAPSKSGRCKAGKGLNKKGSKSHRKAFRGNIQGITKPAFRRLARQGGVKRISGLIYNDEAISDKPTTSASFPVSKPTSFNGKSNPTVIEQSKSLPVPKLLSTPKKSSSPAAKSKSVSTDEDAEMTKQYYYKKVVPKSHTTCKSEFSSADLVHSSISLSGFGYIDWAPEFTPPTGTSWAKEVANSILEAYSFNTNHFSGRSENRLKRIWPLLIACYLEKLNDSKSGIGSIMTRLRAEYLKAYPNFAKDTELLPQAHKLSVYYGAWFGPKKGLKVLSSAPLSDLYEPLPESSVSSFTKLFVNFVHSCCHLHRLTLICTHRQQQYLN